MTDEERRASRFTIEGRRAGRGPQGGVTYGATDELGYAAVEDRVSVHDLHATMPWVLESQ